MNKEELIGKLHMIYAGDRNALEEMVGYYDGLKQVIEILKEENQKLKENRYKAIEYIESYKTDYSPYELSDYNVRQILEILKGDSNE